MNELVSIVIPAYNCERFLEECVQSCLSQSHKPVEIVIVDDSSTDNTFEVASALQSKNTKVFRKQNGGAGAARNFGLTKSTGEYVMFLDADDYLCSDAVQTQLELIRDEKNCVALCNWSKIPSGVVGDLKLTRTKNAATFLILTMLEGLHTQTACWLYPRALIQDIHWSEKRDHPDDDAHFHAQVLSQNPKIKGNELALVMYREHSGERLSQQSSAEAFSNRFVTLEETEKALRKLKVGDSVITKCLMSGAFALLYMIPKNESALFEQSVTRYMKFQGRPQVTVGSFIFRRLANLSPIMFLRLRRLFK